MQLTKLHILIAEDDNDDADLINFSFGKCSYFDRIDIVQNGVELMDFLNENRLNLPHIILTDLNMPKKNGYESLLEIAADKDFSKIPVFVYSTTINPSYALKCKELGARDFIIKPFNLEAIENMPFRLVEYLVTTVPGYSETK
ncbi:MAG: response regulator [Bacteroidota bacterium]